VRIGLTTESKSLLKKRQAEEDSNRTFCSLESSVKIHSRFAPGFAPDSRPHLSSLNHTGSGRIVYCFNTIIVPGQPHLTLSRSPWIGLFKQVLFDDNDGVAMAG
jgi:hypothetical protein